MADNTTQKLFGHEYKIGEYPTQGQYPSSRRAAAGRAFMGAAIDVSNRWRSLWDREVGIPLDKQREMIGDRDIEVDPGANTRDLQFRIDEYDHERWMADYERHPISEFLGMMGPYVVDPVTVATMPVGGSSIRMALKAGATLPHFLRHSTHAGAKIGVASAPIEAAIHPGAYGEFRPDIFAGSVLGPVVAAPVMSAPARALQGLNFRKTSGPDAVSRASQIQPERTGRPEPRMLEAIRAVDEYPGVRPPPAMRDLGGLEYPRQRLNEMFDDYSGGPRQLVRDIIEAKPDALNKMHRLGIDVEAPSFVRFLNRHKEASVRRAQDPGQVGRDVELARKYTRGKATKDELYELRQRGVLTETDEIAAPYRDAMETMRPGARFTPEAQETLRSFGQRGFDGEYTRYIDRLRRDYEGAVDELRQTGQRQLKAMARGKEPSEHVLARMDELRGKKNALAHELDVHRAQIRKGDGEFPMSDFMHAIDAARLESPINELRMTPVETTSRPGDPTARPDARPDDPTQGSAEAARQAGIDDPDLIAREIMEEMRLC